jgi:SNF2 family DNA or RNA helicase
MTFLAEGQVTASTVLSQMLRMQQICSGYVKTDEGVLVELPTNKIKALMSAIEETDGKMIIWCNFTHDLKRVAAELEKAYGVDSYRLFYGDTPTEERSAIVAQFQEPESPLRFFVGQPRSGGYGLTLTEAKTVIYYSNGFDLEVRLQSEDRAHRIGQTNKVTYIDIVVNQSVDDKILWALRRKLNLATEVMAEGYKTWLV